jgi:hypothetical protein
MVVKHRMPFFWVSALCSVYMFWHFVSMYHFFFFFRMTDMVYVDTGVIRRQYVGYIRQWGSLGKLELQSVVRRDRTVLNRWMLVFKNRSFLRFTSGGCEYRAESQCLNSVCIWSHRHLDGVIMFVSHKGKTNKTQLEPPLK